MRTDFRQPHSISSGANNALSAGSSPPIEASQHSNRAMLQQPSYMNAPLVSAGNNLALDWVKEDGHVQDEVDLTPLAPTILEGVVLVAIADKVDAKLAQYMNVLLESLSPPAAQVVIMGLRREEAPLKQLKIEVYGLAGKLSLELGVQVILQEEWKAGPIGTVVHKVAGLDRGGNQSSSSLRAVLCCPHFGDSFTTKDLLALDFAELESSWRTSVGFVHTLAKVTVPPLARNSSGQRLFYVTGIDVGLNTFALEQRMLVAFVDSLRAVHGPSGINFGFADQELTQKLVAEATQTIGGDVSGKLSLETAKTGTTLNIDETSDSPTELYTMWAIANAE